MTASPAHKRHPGLTSIVFCGIFAIGLGFAAPAAKAAGGDDNSGPGASAGSGASGAGTMQKKATGMKKSDLTTCAPGQVWDKKTHKCLERHSGVSSATESTKHTSAPATPDRYQAPTH